MLLFAAQSIADLSVNHPLFATIAAGVATTALTWWIWRAMQTADVEQGAQWRYDISRINELRRADAVYRIFQPLLRVLARFNQRAFRGRLPEIQREMQAAGMPRCWLPEEYLAKLQWIGFLLAPLYGIALYGQMGVNGLPLACVAVMLTIILFRRRLTFRARHRLTVIKRRLPYLLDLLTLLMEAGTTFMRSLEQAIGEFRGHPLSDEFRRVLTDINLGKTRQQAFEAMRDRLQDDEVTGILGSIIQAEQLGTPLAGVFRTQADVLRLKRSQQAETIAAEAGVKILLPSILVMMATVIIILGPFVLNFLVFGLSFN